MVTRQEAAGAVIRAALDPAFKGTFHSSTIDALAD